ncbi:hypothetical protein B0H11DRAFT_1931548 [Mycena galericulata]|nr:hypothetical protein B0H11DRAFT_1931548 [Mycena galericulata]
MPELRLDVCPAATPCAGRMAPKAAERSFSGGPNIIFSGRAALRAPAYLHKKELGLDPVPPQKPLFRGAVPGVHLGAREAPGKFLVPPAAGGMSQPIQCKDGLQPRKTDPPKLMITRIRFKRSFERESINHTIGLKYIFTVDLYTNYRSNATRGGWGRKHEQCRRSVRPGQGAEQPGGGMAREPRQYNEHGRQVVSGSSGEAGGEAAGKRAGSGGAAGGKRQVGAAGSMAIRAWAADGGAGVTGARMAGGEREQQDSGRERRGQRAGAAKIGVSAADGGAGVAGQLVGVLGGGGGGGGERRGGGVGTASGDVGTACRNIGTMSRNVGTVRENIGKAGRGDAGTQAAHNGYEEVSKQEQASSCERTAGKLQ